MLGAHGGEARADRRGERAPNHEARDRISCRHLEWDKCARGERRDRDVHVRGARCGWMWTGAPDGLKMINEWTD